MPRRRDLKGIAGGLLGSFISRNNDLEGYWAIGKLYKDALASGNPVLKIGVLACASTPENSTLQYLASKYQELLLKSLSTSGIPVDWIAACFIEVTFSNVEPGRESQASIRTLKPFWVSVTIKDDIGRNRVAEAQSWCWSHDPEREIQSTRYDDQNDRKLLHMLRRKISPHFFRN